MPLARTSSGFNGNELEYPLDILSWSSTYSKAWVHFQHPSSLLSLQQNLKLKDTHPALREAPAAVIVT